MVVALFGMVMFGLGCLMVIRPLQFSTGVATFARKPWFHAFEITSRLILGGMFVVYAEESAYPLLVTFIGSLLCLVSIFLIIIGSKRHRRFAIFASTIGQRFRYIGILSIVLGLGLAYMGTIS